MKRSDLTPSMRQAVAIVQPGQDMRGLVHGATLQGLRRKGLVVFSNGPSTYEDDWTAELSDTGELVRLELRERVDRLLAAHGYQPSGVFPASPGAIVTDTLHPFKEIPRMTAMRRTGIQW